MEAEAGLERLLGQPGLYRSMIDNGRRRGEEFRVKRSIERWRRCLFEELPGIAGSRPPRLLRRRPTVMAARRLWRSLQLRSHR